MEATVLSELKAAFDTVDSILRERGVDVVQRNRDKVLVAIYKLGGNGRKAVSPEQLEAKGGFSRPQVLAAIKAAEQEDWIIDASSHSGTAWLLKRKAMHYVEGLLKQ
jgi:hypothetical protein